MKLLFILSFVIGALQLNAQSIQYPKTLKSNFHYDYHGLRISDPYAWLEDDNSENTKRWVGEQNNVTNTYLSKISYRDQIKARLTALVDYPKSSAPYKQGQFYFYTKNNGLQNQSVIYFKKGINGKEEVFIDPNTRSENGTTSINLAGFSKDKKYVVASIQKAGSDWQEFEIYEVATKKKLKDELKWIKFSGATWFKNGFYYSRYDAPTDGDALKGVNQFMKIYYHKIGDPQEKDELIYEDQNNPQRYFGVGITEDERFLVLSVSQGTGGSELWVRDLTVANSKFINIISGFSNNNSLIDNQGSNLIILTDVDAPNYKLISVDFNKIQKENWKTVVAEQSHLLESVGTGGGYLFLNYLQNVSTHVFQANYDGKIVREITFPGPGTANGFGAEKTDKDFYYTYTSFTYPPTVYKYDITTGKSELYQKSQVSFNPQDYVSEQKFITMSDGVNVPVFLTYRKGMERNGENPVLLYGYGGFNVSLQPSFSPMRIALLEQGVIFVMANLRGGGEFGESWHQAGMLLNKQRVFDDFIGVAEFLCKSKYTNPSKIAIQGGSNGGLLVGACMVQRPDLFKVALPAVGVMDMYRFHKFTVGWGWIDEYGNPEESFEMFQYISTYSPYHNIKQDVEYPATLVTTADHDDRVVPAHSFKFIAKLQAENKSKNPTLIRIETNAGHGAGKSIKQTINETADVYAFMLWNLGITEFK